MNRENLQPGARPQRAQASALSAQPVVLKLRYTFWPWQALALAAPVMGSVAALIFSLNQPELDDKVLGIFFAIFGGANAYILAMANGSLTRGMLAIPVGSVAGFVAVSLLSSDGGLGFGILVLGAVVIVGVVMSCMSSLEKMGNDSPSSIFLFLAISSPLIIIAMLVMAVIFANRVRDTMMHVLLKDLTVFGGMLCLVVVNAIVCAAMTFSRQIDDLYGLLTGSAQALLSAVIALGIMFWQIYPKFATSLPQWAPCITLGIGSLAFNWIFFWRMFQNIERPAPVQAVAEKITKTSE